MQVDKLFHAELQNSVICQLLDHGAWHSIYYRHRTCFYACTGHCSFRYKTNTCPNCGCSYFRNIFIIDFYLFTYFIHSFIRSFIHSSVHFTFILLFVLCWPYLSTLAILIIISVIALRRNRTCNRLHRAARVVIASASPGLSGLSTSAAAIQTTGHINNPGDPYLEILFSDLTTEWNSANKSPVQLLYANRPLHIKSPEQCGATASPPPPPLPSCRDWQTPFGTVTPFGAKLGGRR